MYNFILNQWILGRISADKVRSYAPKWITADQAEEILEAPQTSQNSVD